ncbi:MAG: hypothetical protein RLZZ58_837 [Pseudomonadota bacterium]
MTDLIFAHPDRVVGGMRPLKAWRHFRKLIADKEDTEQVFHIIEALRDRRYEDHTRRFFATPAGRDAIATNTHLPDLLDDHARLNALPADSVGAAYVAFMAREGLSAAGLVAESEKFRGGDARFDDQLERFGNRLRDTHDLFHILSGYGRDALGEQCVLAFSYGLNPTWGILFIAWAGARVMQKRVPADVRVYAAVREAQALGRAATNIVHQDIAALLAEPLDAARARLNIGEPAAYHAAHAALRAHGIDPFDLLGEKKAASAASVGAAPELAKAA